ASSRLAEHRHRLRHKLQCCLFEQAWWAGTSLTKAKESSSSRNNYRPTDDKYRPTPPIVTVKSRHFPMGLLSSGTNLRSYEVIGLLGKGGMGEVYSASDTKLGRNVAIKVLPQIFTHDPDRVARFKREAKVLAALNHPNIAVIHGLEESGDPQFLVMELVEGETLAEKLARGALPVDETMRSALQIAEALEAAHEKAIVHRDLKPANVKITPDGKVKVLDFGLAKAFEPESTNPVLSNSPTVSGAATNAGVILGTA